ncbi:hypothetical protein BofuT4_P043010.1 [Botrytis cinerea T4]|uniref:Uncharacterized protein n=1 Tax=Botryotinia fuckeliana (strain T4) TaxID=999810 RepID=G2Y200_BOTF4|nr:hypothetical protein BofuT4_P043010.1 [Botrytis cinerea T4]
MTVEKEACKGGSHNGFVSGASVYHEREPHCDESVLRCSAFIFSGMTDAYFRIKGRLGSIHAFYHRKIYPSDSVGEENETSRRQTTPEIPVPAVSTQKMPGCFQQRSEITPIFSAGM